ncbi:hypothetical protein NG799_23800 [Laspinema sp. D1]|uniref:Uncharacterized protein n=1 Tax=Laspinema palackyanum D2a TaxID=2953684 RepID=A0ABT2MZC1_9CYAN|nr:hypothetical protein [Laspinema sp. D2a]
MNHLLELIKFLDVHPLTKSDDLDFDATKEGDHPQILFCSPPLATGSPHPVSRDRGATERRSLPGRSISQGFVKKSYPRASVQ